MRDDELRERFRALADAVGSRADQPAAASIRSRGRRARRRATGAAVAVIIVLTLGGTLLTRALVLSAPQPLGIDELPPPRPTVAGPVPSSQSSTTLRRPDPSQGATTATTEAPTTTAARTTTTGAGAPDPCGARQLSAENGGVGGAAGSRGLTVVLRNAGGTACTVTGAPAVVLLRDGAVLPTHADREDAGSPATVTLRPARAVTFYILWANPSLEEEDLSTCQPDSTHVRLTPRGQDGALTVAAALDSCHGNVRVSALQP